MMSNQYSPDDNPLLLMLALVTRWVFLIIGIVLLFAAYDATSSYGMIGSIIMSAFGFFVFIGLRPTNKSSNQKQKS